LLLIPLVIQKKINLFSLSNVSPGYGETYPLQTAALTAEVTAAQHRRAPEDAVPAPDPGAVERSRASSPRVGSGSLLTQQQVKHHRRGLSTRGSHPPLQAPCGRRGTTRAGKRALVARKSLAEMRRTRNWNPAGPKVSGSRLGAGWTGWTRSDVPRVRPCGKRREGEMLQVLARGKGWRAHPKHACAETLRAGNQSKRPEHLPYHIWDARLCEGGRGHTALPGAQAHCTFRAWLWFSPAF